MMGKAFQLGNINGIPIRIHWTFPLLFLWIGVMAVSSGADLVGMIGSMGFILIVFACVVLHELGHALAARRYGIGTRDITLLPIGGVAQLERMPRKPREEIVIALAGPAVNLVIAATLISLFVLASLLGNVNPSIMTLGLKLALVNAALVVFNMVPAFPMDGGRVLRALLAMTTDYVKATRVAASVGKFCALGFLMIGIWGNPILILIAAFIFLAASSEARQVAMRESLSGFSVGDGMTRQFASVPPDVYVRDVAISLLETDQERFPVVDDRGSFLGMIDRGELIQAVNDTRVDMQVSHVMSTTDGSVRESDSLTDVMERLGSGLSNTLAVTRDGVLTGLLEIPRAFQIVRAKLHLRDPLIRPRQPAAASDTVHAW